jgi:acetyltransferase
VSIRNLDKIFKPQRVAVIGASNQRGSVGHTVLHNLINTNFPGVVYPVNPKYEAVHGIQTYPDVKGLPHPPDLALICTPARTVPGIIRECGEAGVLGVIIISAGFRETGKDGKALEQQVTEELARFKGMRMIGPNCLGIIAPGQHLNASFAAATPKLGHVAFVSQSGALCTSVLDWALEADIGFSFFVSVGNMLDVDIADLIDYFGRDPHTHSIILYVESITGARKFLSAARAFCRTKPIIAYKAGRFTESAQAAASHTGALAGEDAVYDAAFERAGIVRVFEIDDIFDAAELLAHQQLPDGPRLAIVTNAGGPGVMATDYLISRGGILARLSETTLQRLDEGLPSFWSHGNPVDVLGDAPAERFAQASQVVLEDSSVDALLVILTPQAMTDPKRTAQVVGALEAGTRKPILASWMGGDRVHAGIQVLNRSGIPTYTTPEQAVSAFMHLVRYARNLETIQETPRNIPVEFRLDRHRLRQFFNTILSERHEVLSETLSKALLDAYEIPVTTPYTARTADEAVEQARWLGYPVVLKVLSAQITHKSDVGGVAINLFSEKEVRGAFEAIVTRAQQKRPEAQVEGVTVQRMVDTKDSVELILGTKKDPTMGAVIMVGTGGTAAEVFRDRTLALPPLNERLARRMLESLRAWPLLQGYRGKPAVNLDRLLETLMRLSYLVAD